MHRTFLILAAVIAAITVGLGAFAAHALKDLVSDKAIATFETAVKYQFYHVIALFIVGILYRQYRNGFVLNAGRCFLFGMLLFSGSLYALSIVQAMVSPGLRWVGAITPIGGLLFISGWLLLGFGILKGK